MFRSSDVGEVWPEAMGLRTFLIMIEFYKSKVRSNWDSNWQIRTQYVVIPDIPIAALCISVANGT